MTRTVSPSPEQLSELQHELHVLIWEAGKSATPLKGYPVADAEKNAFQYGKDCATADIETAVRKYITHTADALESTQAEIAELRSERDNLLQKPIDLSKLDSIDDGVGEKMVAYYWWEQAQEARAEIARLTTVSGDMVEEMARAICTLNSGGYCDCVGESLGCKVGRGEPPERSRCKMTDEALPLSAECQMAQAAATIAKGRMEAIDGILAEAERLVLDGHPSRALLRVEEARAALKGSAG
jgi:hypothetical protein